MMKMIRTDLSFIGEDAKKLIETFRPEADDAVFTLERGSGRGNDFLGWQALPFDYDRNEVSRIKAAAAKIRESAEVFVVIGIGGSYLGARAVIEAVKGLYHNDRCDGPKIYFAGNSVSADALNEVLDICRDKDFCINVISKSGTTTEPGVAFRAFSRLLTEKYGDGADERIYVTTDKARGALKALTDKKGWESFVVPDDVGGRFSVLTAVGLLPIAVAGCDIDALLKGAADSATAQKGVGTQAEEYALARFAMLNAGKSVEIMVSYEPRLTMFAEWFKQLYGESEGKEGKGLFPAACAFSTDLHSMGQYIQDGQRIIFETVLSVESSATDYDLGSDDDGIAFLNGQKVSFVNRMAQQGTILAHCDGGVPNVILRVDALDEYNVGAMIYFFEKACGISAYLLGVNPFDQPGVESYKKNMFALLGKPGFEELREDLNKRLRN
ncbi:MAG: glucose-6-phosphate isomerase [Clostridia bacterium]|nr:glucose-6-phosphate isomerase [Clostridia bacterium]